MTERMPIKEAKKKFIKRSFYCGVVAILVCWFMKLFGFDYFGLDLDNKFFNDLNDVLDKFYLKDIFVTIFLNIQLYFLVGCVNKEQGSKVWLYLLKILPITIIYRILIIKFNNQIGNLSVLIDFLYLICVTTKLKLRKLPKSLLIILFNLIYQVISLQTRSMELKAHTFGFVEGQILNIDYYILLYLHKEMEVNKMGNDTTFLFFGFTAWLYRVAGFIVGLFTLHPIKKSREWYEKGKAKEDARKTKKATK